MQSHKIETEIGENDIFTSYYKKSHKRITSLDSENTCIFKI